MSFFLDIDFHAIHSKDKMSTGEATAINIRETKTVSATTKATQDPRARWKRGLAIFDFIFRLGAIAATLAAATTMGTTDQTLPFFTQFFQFEASYDDLPTFTFFVIATALASGYLVLSLPFSIVCIVRPHAMGARLLLTICDIVVLALTIAAASAAAAIVYLAHNGDPNANWAAICQQFGDFCQSVSGAVVSSFVAAVFFMLMVVLSAISLRKH